MNYGNAEVEIAQRITDGFAELGLSDKYYAAPMPDTDKEAKEFEAQITKARVAVEYMESSFENDNGTGAVRQVEHPKFRLVFEARKMRGEGGLYTMIEHVKRFLLGYSPTDAGPLTIAGYGKLDFEPGVWMPYLDFECKTLNVQAFTNPDEIGGAFTGLETSCR